MRRIASVSCHSVTVEHGTSWLFVDVMWQDAGPTYERFRVHIEDCERIEPKESVDETEQRNERVFQNAFAAYLKLTGREPRASVAVHPDTYRRMQAIVIAAEAWVDVWEYCGRGSPQGAALRSAVQFAPLPVQGKEQGLTAEEREALMATKRVLVADEGRGWQSPHNRNLISALDKLLALQGER